MPDKEPRESEGFFRGMFCEYTVFTFYAESARCCVQMGRWLLRPALRRITAELVRYLADQYEPEMDAFVLLDDEGRAQPFSGVYSRSCLPVLEQHLKTDRLKMMQMLEEMQLQKTVLPVHLSSAAFET